MITDLLATCAYGDNEGADSVCCTIFCEEELIEIISHDNINIYRKRPFMKFLISVYMNAQGEQIKKKARYYNKNEYVILVIDTCRGTCMHRHIIIMLCPAILLVA